MALKPRYLASSAPELYRRLNELVKTYGLLGPDHLLEKLINAEYDRLERVRLVPKSPAKFDPRAIRKCWRRRPLWMRR